MINYLL